jgi:tetratricopeptide (TPR) repeat protein
VALARRASAWLAAGDPTAACQRLRGFFALEDHPDPDPGLLWLWIRAEARLGRWRAAFDAAILRLAGRGPHPGLLGAATAAALASGRSGLARALAGLVGARDASTGALLEAACALADREPSLALACLDRRDGEEADASWARLLRAEAYRLTGHLRSAQRLLASCGRQDAAPEIGLEALRARARLERDLGRPGRALGFADQALPRARRLGVPDLVSRVQRERGELLEARGARRDAAAARRAAGALDRRSGADGVVHAGELPLHGLMELRRVPLPGES